MNTKWFKMGAVAVAAASLIAGAGASAAYAGSVPQPQAGVTFGRGGGNGAGMMQYRPGGPNNSLVATAAQVMGIERTELVAALDGGKSIASVAAEKGVALDKIVDAVIAPRAAALQSLVASGRRTQAQADAMLAAMKANITAQLQAPFSPRGTGNTDGACDGTCDRTPGQMQRQGGRWGR